MALSCGDVWHTMSPCRVQMSNGLWRDVGRVVAQVESLGGALGSLEALIGLILVVVDRLAFDLSIGVIIDGSERLGDRDPKKAVLVHL